MSTKKKIGIGVISLGWMGRLHARSYRTVSERFPELDAEAHSALTASILADFLSDNGVAFGDEGFDWTENGAATLVIAHCEASADEAEEAA